MCPLLAPHGGLTEPVCRTVPVDEIPDFLARAKTLVKVPISDADLSTVYRFGDGHSDPDLWGPRGRPVDARIMRQSTAAILTAAMAQK